VRYNLSDEYRSIYFKQKDLIIIQYLDALGQENETQLCSGKNSLLMNEARGYLNSNNDLDVAWRAYDPGAPITGWESLLTEPVRRPSHAVNDIYSRYLINAPRTSIKHASVIARTFWAYTYLLINEPESQREVEYLLDMFIIGLSETRRAHSTIDGEDASSCLPDICTRAGSIMQLCPLGFGLRDLQEFIGVLLSSVVVQEFKSSLENEPSLEGKKNIYYAVLILNETTAVEVLKGAFSWVSIDGEGDRCSFNEEILSIRLDFIQKIWANGTLLLKINEQLAARASNNINKEDIFGFLNNIEGSWVRDKLSNVYSTHMQSLIPVEPENYRVRKPVNPYQLTAAIKSKISKNRQSAYECLSGIWNISSGGARYHYC
jgi:hypothetical protein